MPVPVNDVALFRRPLQSTEIRLNAFPRVTVATALINQAVFAYPLAQVTVDNTSAGWTGVKAGMLIVITDGSGNTILTSTCRKDATSNTLFLSALNLGDSGFAENIQPFLADNQTVTVYSVRTAWAFLSRIAAGVFYKRFDVAYTDEGSNPVPVCNVGHWQQADCIAGVAEFALSASASYAHGSKTITAYSWVLPTGVSLASGNLTDASITVEADPGNYIVACTVTDSGSKTHTAYTYLFANDGVGGTNPALSDSAALRITRDDQTRDGRELTIELTLEQNSPDVFYPGAPIHLKEYPTFGGAVLEGDDFVSDFCGYITDYAEVVGNNEFNRIEITVKSPYLLARQLPIAPQLLEVATSPANWTQLQLAYMTPATACWYLLQHHAPELLTLHDFDRGGVTDITRLTYELKAADLAGQLKNVSELVLGTIGSASDGTFCLRRNPVLEDNTYRNAIDNLYEWTESDITAPLAYNWRYRMQTGQTIGYAFAYSGSGLPTPLAAISGRAQGQATGKGRTPDFAVTLAQGQAKVNATVGHYHAMENAAVSEINVTAALNIDIIDPARMVWHTIDVSAAYDPVGIVAGLEPRTLPTKVTRSWAFDRGSIIKRVQFSAQLETFGQPAETLPIEFGGASSWVQNGSIIGSPTLFTREESLIDQLSFTLVINDAGELARTFNFLDDEPNYELL